MTRRATPPRGRTPGRIPARPWLRHLGAHVPVAAAGDDPEGVHQVRVAAGRLAVWLELGGREVLRDDLRALRRCAAEVRDADVLLARRPPAAFAARLAERRERAREAMLPHLRGPHARALRAALALLPAIDASAAERALPSFRDRVLRRGDALAARRPPHDEDFHALRRAVRKLRYALEWLRTDAAAVRGLQQVLGELNDLAVEQRVLRESGGARAFPRRAAMLRRRLLAFRRRALLAWRRARPAIASLCGGERP